MREPWLRRPGGGGAGAGAPRPCFRSLRLPARLELQGVKQGRARRHLRFEPGELNANCLVLRDGRPCSLAGPYRAALLRGGQLLRGPGRVPFEFLHEASVRLAMDIEEAGHLAREGLKVLQCDALREVPALGATYDADLAGGRQPHEPEGFEELLWQERLGVMQEGLPLRHLRLARGGHGLGEAVGLRRESLLEGLPAQDLRQAGLEGQRHTPRELQLAKRLFLGFAHLLEGQNLVAQVADAALQGCNALDLRVHAAIHGIFAFEAVRGQPLHARHQLLRAREVRAGVQLVHRFQRRDGIQRLKAGL